MAIRDLLISLRVKDGTKPIDDADRKMKRAKGSAEGLVKSLKGIAGAFLGMAAAQKAYAEVKEGVEAAGKFGAGIAQIASLMPGQQKRVEELRAGIMKLALETGKPLEDLSAGAYQVISAFGDSADTLKQLEISAKAAVAGNSSTAEALGLLSAVTNSYGEVSAEASMHTANLAQNTVALGKTTLPELSHAMGTVAGQAAALKITQEELFGVFAANAVVMNGADHVATGMVATLAELTRAGSPSNLAIKKLGFSTAESALETLGFTGTLQKLAETTDGTADAIAKLIPGTEAQKLVMHAVRDRVKAADDAIVSNAKATDVMTTAYHEATTGAGALAFELAKAQARLEAQRVELGEKMAPTLLTLEGGLHKVKAAFIEAFIDQMPGIEAFGRILAGPEGVDGKLQGVQEVAETVAAAVRLTIGTLSLVFLELKRNIGIAIGDTLALKAALSGNFEGARLIMAQVEKDRNATDSQIGEILAELGRSPEQSRQHAQQVVKQRAREQLGFEPQYSTDGRGLAPVGNGVFQHPNGSLSYGPGPFAANLPGIDGQMARAEIKELNITIEGNKSTREATNIVRDGVGGALHDAIKGGQRMVPGVVPAGARNWME